MSFCVPLVSRAGNHLFQPQTVRGGWYALVIFLTPILLAAIMGVALGQVLDPSGDLPSPVAGHGRIDALAAVNALGGMPSSLP